MIGGKRYVPWINLLGSGPRRIYCHGLRSRLEFKAAGKFLALAGFGFTLVKWQRVARYWHWWIEAACKLLVGICELLSVCKVLALVNWSSVQALGWLLWIGNSLQGFGTGKLALALVNWSSVQDLASSCRFGFALVKWRRVARYWPLWIEAVCKLLLGMCELLSVCKVLARVNWSSVQALGWLLWIDNSLQGFGTGELATICKVLALVNWEKFARYLHLQIGNRLQGIGTGELATVWNVLALVNWQQFARCLHLWIKVVCKLWFIIGMGKVWLGTCLLATVCKVLALVNWSCVLAFVWHLWVDISLQVLGTCELKQFVSFGFEDGKLWFVICELATVCKVLIFVNWSCLLAFVLHLWIDIGLQVFGTCELKKFASFWFAQGNWEQVASWHRCTEAVLGCWRIEAVCKLFESS